MPEANYLLSVSWGYIKVCTVHGLVFLMECCDVFLAWNIVSCCLYSKGCRMCGWILFTPS